MERNRGYAEGGNLSLSPFPPSISISSLYLYFLSLSISSFSLHFLILSPLAEYISNNNTYIQLKKKKSLPNFGWKLGNLSHVWKVHQAYQENYGSSLGKVGKFIRKIRKIRKDHQENQEKNLIVRKVCCENLEKNRFVRKVNLQYQESWR